MKKITLSAAILLIALMLVSCASTANKINGNIITIDISEETEKYREEKVFASDADPRTLTDAQNQAMFEITLEMLKTRVQTFPEVETANKLDKFVCAGSDVYTLTSGNNYDNIVLYIHGGAWINGIDAVHVQFCDKIVNELNATVYMPLYELAPQSNAAEGYAMLTTLYKELLKQNKPIFVMGDSAGGALTLGLVLKLKDEGIKLPEKVVPIAPCADSTFTNKKIQKIQKVDGLLPWLFCKKCAELWAGGTDLKNPYVSPVYGDFTGFPDTLMYIGTYDILSADDIVLFNKMTAAGVDAKLVVGKGFWHVYVVSDIKEQPQLIQILKDFCLN